MAACLVYMTAETPEAAQRIGRALVEARLAACVNILGSISSIYRWEGEIVEDGETAFIAKTRDELVPALTARVTELHSYDCPCVIALPVSGGNLSFLDWIAAETGAAP